jgi:hypothetical protein
LSAGCRGKSNADIYPAARTIGAGHRIAVQILDHVELVRALLGTIASCVVAHAAEVAARTGSGWADGQATTAFAGLNLVITVPVNLALRLAARPNGLHAGSTIRSGAGRSGEADAQGRFLGAGLIRGTRRQERGYDDQASTKTRSVAVVLETHDAGIAVGGTSSRWADGAAPAALTRFGHVRTVLVVTALCLGLVILFLGLLDAFFLLLALFLLALFQGVLPGSLQTIEPEEP